MVSSQMSSEESPRLSLNICQANTFPRFLESPNSIGSVGFGRACNISLSLMISRASEAQFSPSFSGQKFSLHHFVSLSDSRRRRRLRSSRKVFSSFSVSLSALPLLHRVPPNSPGKAKALVELKGLLVFLGVVLGSAPHSSYAVLIASLSV